MLLRVSPSHTRRTKIFYMVDTVQSICLSLEKWRIEASNHPRGSPLVLARKRDGTVWITENWILWSSTMPSYSHDPWVIRGTYWVFCLDLVSGYWQLLSWNQDKQTKNNLRNKPRSAPSDLSSTCFDNQAWVLSTTDELSTGWLELELISYIFR